MEHALEAKEKPPKIDDRILDAVTRNRQYLGMSEWLEQYHLARDKPASQFGDKLAV